MTTSATLSRRAADLWWLHPTRIVVLVLMPIYASFLFFDFARVVKNVYVPGAYYLWGVALMVAMVAGVQWALMRPSPGPAAALPRFSHGVMMVLLGVTLGAYALWYGPLLANPQALLEIVSGHRQEVRGAVTTTPGVTTLTQLGVAYAIAYGIKLGDPSQRVTRLETVGCVLVIMLAAFRAFAWAERLALIEVVVCFAVARLATLRLGDRAGRVMAFGPVLAVPLLYLLFTASEYFRSWDYYTHLYSSVWAFSFDRLVTYYATATNNGIGILVDTSDWPKFSGAYVFRFAWVMPGLGSLLERVFGPMLPVEDEFLEMYARIEFNSPTAFFRAVLDFGFLGSAIYFIAVGYLIGRAYVGFRDRRLFGLLSYPVLVLYLIEALRYSYLAETRIVPLMLGLAILAIDARRLGLSALRPRRAAFRR
jgi:hypothetical protein